MKKAKYIVLIVLTFILVILPITIKEKDTNNDYSYIENNNISTKTETIISYDYSKDINDYKTKYNNNEVVGIINFENTDYSKPIMQHNDNDYYLNHDEYMKSNYRGAVFADYRIDIINSRKILIFAHNAKYIDANFKILDNYYNYDYFKNHQFISITTNEGKKVYQIFSVYVETSDFSYMNVNFPDEESWVNHLNKLKSKSLYDTSVEVKEDDEILILQTCSTHDDYKDYSQKYLLIIARRVKNEEKIY